MKHALVVAYSFAPSSVTGTFRTLAFVKYLEEFGYRCTVLTTENPIDSERDDRLMEQVPRSAKIVRARDRDVLAWQKDIRQRFATTTTAAVSPAAASTGGKAGGTSLLSRVKRSVIDRLRPYNHNPGWRSAAIAAGREVVKRDRPDVVFSSGPPWTCHLVAQQLVEEFSLPWIADFRDPWVGNPFKPQQEWLEARDIRLERRVLNRANAVVGVLDTMRDDILSRYPHRSPSDVCTIMNGFDPDVLGHQERDRKSSGNTPLTILHAGKIYGRRRIEPMLQALRSWADANTSLAGNVRLHLLGGEESQVESLRHRVMQADVSTMVEVEGEVSHGDAVAHLSNADILLLVGFSGRGEQFQMSGKIFEYLAVRRAILALAPPTCPVGDVLRSSGVRHWIIPPDDVDGIRSAMDEIFATWRSGELEGPQSSSSLAAFNRREQAGMLAELMDRVTTSDAAPESMLRRATTGVP